MKRIVRSAFTLIELLTVLAITALLMTIIVVPVFQSFNFTRSAQAFGEAQSRAQVVADRISRAIGNGVSVRSLTNLVPTYLNNNATNVPAHSLIILVPKRGSGNTIPPPMIEVVLPYSKLDIITAAEGDVPASPGIFTNPVNGFTDPTLQSSKGQPVLPAAPGATIIRYFIGLRNPAAPSGYNNPYDGILMSANGTQDNLYVLYKAEVTPFVYRAGTGSNGDTSLKYRPNTTYFQSDAATDTQILDIDDPRFFLIDNSPNIGLGLPKATRVKNWQAVSVLQTELSRYDMIQPIYDKFSHAATYVGDAPLVVPLIQFRPTHVTNDPARGQVAVRPGEETDNAATIGPDIYMTTYGLWSNQTVRVWPENYSALGGVNNGFNQYFVGRNDPSNGQPGAPPGYSVYYYDPANSPTDYNSGTEVFDITTYENVITQQGLYPFSQGLNAANGRSGWIQNDPMIVQRFTAFDMNTGKGKVTFGFPISMVGNPSVQPSATNPQNLPTVLTSNPDFGPCTPTQDPNYIAPANGQAGYIPGNFYDARFQSINELFNYCYVDAPNLSTQIDRFIDLRVTPMADGTPSPLHPTLGFPRCTITPGSEVVYGPDQLPGPNQGNIVRYVRTTRTPGPNQYQINYVDQPEPRDPPTPQQVLQDSATGGAIDYTLIGLTSAQIAGFNPAVYDPQNFCSAVIQPRYKKGYIRFNSDPNSPLPLGQIQVSYRFQFNGAETSISSPTEVTPIPNGLQASDVVAVDYDTRQLMSVLLTIRNYPQTTNIPNPQTVTVKATATVRNVIR